MMESELVVVLAWYCSAVVGIDARLDWFLQVDRQFRGSRRESLEEGRSTRRLTPPKLFVFLGGKR